MQALRLGVFAFGKQRHDFVIERGTKIVGAAYRALRARGQAAQEHFIRAEDHVEAPAIEGRTGLKLVQCRRGVFDAAQRRNTIRRPP